MFKKILILLFMLSLNTAYSQTKTEKIINIVLKQFENGKYNKSLEVLNKFSKKLENKNSKKANQLKGLLNYWKGMSYSRINEFDKAIEYFSKAIELKYETEDLFYEYGQVLYVNEKYYEAQKAFKKSFDQGHKRGVSLYYIGFISQELKNYKKAVSYYSMIEKLSDDEKKDVLQASRMQIADLYLLQVEKLPDAFSSIQKYVIPQYQKALDWDKESTLAKDIQIKIRSIQKKYELLLFKMRNGKPTSIPPYYLRANILYGSNDNVSTLSKESKASKTSEDYSSNYITTGLFGRYSFYPNSSFSLSPELSASYTKYLSDNDNIIIYNNYFFKSALKMNYEHIYNSAPATFYIDLDYTYNADDTDADKTLEFSDSIVGITLSEEMQIFQGNPTTFRIGYSQTEGEDSSDSLDEYNFTLEQVYISGTSTWFWYNDFSLTRYKEISSEQFNSNKFTTRLDYIMSTLWGLFNPSLYTSLAATNYIEDSERGVTNLTTYGLNLNRPLFSKWYGTLDMSYSTQTGKSESDEYDQTIISFNLEYIY